MIERKLFIPLPLGTMTQPTKKSAFERIFEQGSNLASRTWGNILRFKNQNDSPNPMVDWKEYASRTRNSLKSQNLLQAKQEIQYALEIYPNHLNLLIVANDVYRASDEREKSLEYSELLITHHPDNWNGYGRAAQDLFALKRFEEAQEKIQAGLEKIPNQVNLLKISEKILSQIN